MAVSACCGDRDREWEEQRVTKMEGRESERWQNEEQLAGKRFNDVRMVADGC